MTDGDRLERRGRELLVGLAAGSDERVAELTADGVDPRGAWTELTDTFGEFEGIDAVERSGDTVEATVRLAAGEFVARFEFEDGVVTDFAITKADAGGLGLLVRLGLARVRGVVDRLSPFGESETDVARRIVDRLDDGAYDEVHADLSPVVRSELSAEEFRASMERVWTEKVGSVESVRRVQPVDDDVFVVVEGSDGPARIAVSFAPDGAPAGVALATPAQAGQMVVSRVLRGGRYDDLANSVPPDARSSAPDRVAERWERLLEEVGDVESVGEPRVTDELAVRVPVSAAGAEFDVRVELDDLLLVRRLVVGGGDETPEAVAGTTLFEARSPAPD